MRQVVLDTETTGLEPSEGHRIVEFGAVEIVHRQLTGRTLHCYLNPDRESDPGALNVHGLTSEFLADKPRFPEVAHRLADFVDGAEVIIHNAAFDVGFLDAELGRAGLPGFASLCGRITDSLQVARAQHPGKRNTLDALCERYGISNAHRVLHGALLDSELLAEVWLAMTRGQDSLVLDAQAEGQGANVALHAPLDGARGRTLPVILPTPSELEHHRAFMQALEKESQHVTPSGFA
ncbi:MAG: DNA polymerase III subunit epsilon [Castellaniella sp.]